MCEISKYNYYEKKLKKVIIKINLNMFRGEFRITPHILYFCNGNFFENFVKR